MLLLTAASCEYNLQPLMHVCSPHKEAVISYIRFCLRERIDRLHLIAHVHVLTFLSRKPCDKVSVTQRLVKFEPSIRFENFAVTLWDIAEY